MNYEKNCFMLIAMFGVVLTACSAFDSKLIEPKIIGTGNLQYEAKSGTWFVVIDSTQYTIACVTMPDHNPRTSSNTQDIDPVEGMLVTVFTSQSMKGPQAVIGRQSVEQIEELYHTNSTGFYVVFGVLMLCVIGLTLPWKKQSPYIRIVA